MINQQQQQQQKRSSDQKQTCFEKSHLVFLFIHCRNNNTNNSRMTNHFLHYKSVVLNYRCHSVGDKKTKKISCSSYFFYE